MRLRFHPYLLSLVATVSFPNQCQSERYVYSIHHDIGNGFHPRGTAVVVDVDPETSKITTTVEDFNKDANSCDPSENTNLLRSLITNDGFYKIKIVDETIKSTAITSIPACTLLRSQFREDLTLSIGTKGELLSFFYVPLVSPLAPKTCSTVDGDDNNVNIPANMTFTTNVAYSTATPAMTIPVILPSARPPAGLKFFDTKSSRIEGLEEEKKNVGFLRRYWYIFLPMMILSLIGGGEEEQPQQQRGGMGGQEQQSVEGGGDSVGTAGVASAGVAAGAMAGGASKRRGKRG